MADNGLDVAVPIRKVSLAFTSDAFVSIGRNCNFYFIICVPPSDASALWRAEGDELGCRLNKEGQDAAAWYWAQPLAMVVLFSSLLFPLARLKGSGSTALASSHTQTPTQTPVPLPSVSRSWRSFLCHECGREW